MRANEQTDERVTQYYSLYSWLLSTIVLSPNLRIHTDLSQVFGDVFLGGGMNEGSFDGAQILDETG